MTGTGKVPPDNPFPGSLIFTYGLRNSYGFAFDPQTGLLWQTENGPLWNDEINLERPGENHGWGPTQTCSVAPPAPQNTNQDGPNPVLPLAWFTPTTAPTGAVFCDGCGLTGFDGTLLFGTYNTSEIRQVTLTADRRHIASLTTVFHAAKSVLSMERGPTGRSTSATRRPSTAWPSSSRPVRVLRSPDGGGRPTSSNRSPRPLR